MPQPLAETLSPRVRQLLPIIESGVTAGLSSRAINDALVEATGTGLRRQTLLDIIREIQGVDKFGETLKNVRLDRTPDPDRVPTALTRIRRNFGSTVRVSGFDLNTGESIDRYVQVTHDDPLTRGEIEDTALGFLEDDSEAYPFDITDVLLVRQVKRAA